MSTWLWISLALTSLTSPEEMLKQADHFRTPAGSFKTKVEVRESNGDFSAFDVYTEGNEKSLIVTVAPEKDLGRNLLMLDRDMWIFIPNINRPVRIALKQKLFGQVAQGDIARMKWAGDYSVKLSAEKPEVKEGRRVFRLELSAAKTDLTYDRIRLWVDEKDYRPLFAEYLAGTGKILKYAAFEDYGPLGGAIRPRKMLIRDALKSDQASTVVLKEMKALELPKSFFTQSNLSKPRLK